MELKDLVEVREILWRNEYFFPSEIDKVSGRLSGRYDERSLW